MLNRREAKREGRERGRAAAGWKFDGNTTDATYLAFLRGWEDGDPAVLDVYDHPAWLSGEWAGESMAELLDISEDDDNGSERFWERRDEIATIYEDAATDAYWSELQRVALFQVGREWRARRRAERRKAR